MAEAPLPPRMLLQLTKALPEDMAELEDLREQCQQNVKSYNDERKERDNKAFYRGLGWCNSLQLWSVRGYALDGWLLLEGRVRGSGASRGGEGSWWKEL
jgi:hypothetical protein